MRTLLLATVAAVALGAGALPPARAAAPDLTRGDLVAGTGELRPAEDRAVRSRYAIVIGNAEYAVAADLPNARADALLMAGFLRGLGYRVIERHDVTRLAFENLLRQALFEIEPDSEVVFYYAGHGFQIGRRNFLLPVDSDLTTPHDLAFDTVTLDSLVAILGARARLQVVVLDSCRNNPFAAQTAIAGLSSEPQMTETGFSPVAAPVNTLIAYSTAPGAVALDGNGANSPFTSALVDAVGRYGDEPVAGVLEAVRREVYRVTQGRQVPWESSTLVEAFRFRPEAGIEPVLVGTPGAPGPGAAQDLYPAAAVTRGDPPAIPGLPKADAYLSAPLERRVAVGPGLAAVLPAGSGAVAVEHRTEDGSLVLVAADGTLVPYDGRLLQQGELAALAWQNAPVQERALARPEDHLIRRILTLRPEAGRPVAVALDLVPGACDFLAGDHLDPEGSGIARYPNEIPPDEARAACLAEIAANPDSGRLHYQLARAEIALRDYEAARASLERARDLGHTRAWYGLGLIEGAKAALTGGKVDAAADEAAYPFYFEGVRRGDPYAYFALGKQLLRYSDNSELQTIGFDLLSRALEVGHTFAMNELGVFFLDDTSDHFEPERGLRYWRESAGRGDIYGFNNLGFVYEKGLGGEPADFARAAEWYRKAAEGGHPTAPRNLGRLYEAGQIGTAPDPATALRWYDEGLKRGDGPAGANAAWLIATAAPNGFDLADAAVRAAQAATLRNEGGKTDALDLLRQMPEPELARAMERLLASADLTAGERAALPAASLDRLLAVAALGWEKSRFRVDLY